MIRGTKFRGFDSVLKEWVYGYYTKTSFGNGFSDSIVVFDGEYTKPVKVDPESIGQYTGLKDLNGVDIYEDDIVKDIYKGVSVVTCCPHSASFYCEDYRDGLGMDEFGSLLEVIGNVYENPKLMQSMV